MATITGATGGSGGYDTTGVNTTGVRSGNTRTDDEVCYASYLLPSLHKFQRSDVVKVFKVCHFRAQ